METNCVIPLCTSERKSLGLCYKHYKQWNDGRNKEKIAPYVLTKRPKALCSICKKVANARKLCTTHYIQWRKTDPLERWKIKQSANKRARTLKGRYQCLQQKAKLKGNFDVSFEQFEALSNQRCVYCDSKREPTGAGLDRMDSSKGYTTDNVVPCCRSCNLIKSDQLTFEEMKVAMDAVLSYRIRVSSLRCLANNCNNEITQGTMFCSKHHIKPDVLV